MEKKEIRKWRDRLIKMFGVYHSDGQEYVTCPLCGINLDELADHMIKELDKAREEGARDVFTKEEWFTMEELAYLGEVMHLDYSLAVTFGQREKSDIGGGLLRKLDKLNKKK